MKLEPVKLEPIKLEPIRLMGRAAIAVCLFTAGTFTSAAAWAQDVEEIEAVDGEAVEQPVAEATESGDASGPKVFQAIVRGFFIEAKVGGGLVIVDDDVGPNNFNPPIAENASEGLGGGVMVAMSVGYDVNDFIALQLNGGSVMVSGTRDDLVRDMGLYYAGVGVRFTFDLDDRLKFTLSPGASFVAANAAIGGTESGPGINLATGIEYFAHVRHFSVGLELQFFVPLSPFRMFVGLTPTIKYTF